LVLVNKYSDKLESRQTEGTDKAEQAAASVSFWEFLFVAKVAINHWKIVEKVVNY
jgi:hypothetical protein